MQVTLGRQAMWYQQKRYRTIAETEEFARLIAKHFSMYSIDMVIGIESGGWLPAKVVAEGLGVELYTLTIRRNIDLERIYRLCRGPMHPIGAIWQGIEFLVRDPEAIGTTDLNKLCTHQNVLVVDDTAQSGKTLMVAKKILNTAKSIKTAVVCDVYGRAMADYAVIKGVNYFPWSRSSAEYPTYCALRSAGHE